MSMRENLKLPLVLLLAAAGASLAGCGGSSGLIPAGSAGPLRSDFEAVAEAAENGNGNCSKTESALESTQHDYERLPSSVDSGLRNRLSEGISHLRSQALLACKNPSGGGATTTATVSKPTITTSSTPTTTTTTTTTTSTEEATESTTHTESSAPNGGTPPSETPGGHAGEGHAGEGNPGGVSPEEDGGEVAK
jgi:cytoskeletal protein RodZ